MDMSHLRASIVAANRASVQHQDDLTYNLPMDSTGTTTEALAGSIERVTFHNPDSGFSVLRLKVKGRTELVSVVGPLWGITMSW